MIETNLLGQLQINDIIIDSEKTIIDSEKIKPTKTKTSVRKWLINSEQHSVRLYNVLMSNLSSNDRPSWKGPPVDFIEDYTKKRFLLTRNAGKGTFEEFCRLTGINFK